MAPIDEDDDLAVGDFPSSSAEIRQSQAVLPNAAESL
jgi:hypothetical protein